MKRLRDLRKLAGVTQIELSLRTGIDRARLSFAENGYVELTADEQAQIRKLLARTAEASAAAVRREVGAAEDRAMTTAGA